MPEKQKQGDKPKLTISEVVIPIKYNLVYWPDGCSDVPEYDDVLDTLEIINTVLDKIENEEPISSDLKQTVLLWMMFNDIEKFEKYSMECEKHQRIIRRMKVDNLEFPFPLHTYKREH